MISIKVAALFWTLFLIAGFAHAQDDETLSTTATGAGVIRGGDLASAKDSALADALRKAVEQAVGVYVESETLVENYQLVEDKIYSRTQGYVRKYSITQDGPPQMSINLYEITIEAEVSSKILQDDLAAIGLLLTRKNMPRTMVFMVEQSIGQERYVVGHWNFFSGSADLMSAQTRMGSAENALLGHFSQKGFPMADRQVKRGSIELDSGFLIDKLTDGQVRKMGNLTDAEIVIYGKALATQQGALRGSAMQSANAVVSARVVRTDTGQVIAAGNATGAAVHMDAVTAGNEALVKASEALAEDLFKKIIAVWGRETTGAQLVNLQIKGIPDYSTFARFKRSLKEEIRGVEALYQRRLSDSDAEMDVDMKGTAQDLADSITFHSFKDFKIVVERISQNQIDLSFVVP